MARIQYLSAAVLLALSVVIPAAAFVGSALATAAPYKTSLGISMLQAPPNPEADRRRASRRSAVFTATAPSAPAGQDVWAGLKWDKDAKLWVKSDIVAAGGAGAAVVSGNAASKIAAGMWSSVRYCSARKLWVPKEEQESAPHVAAFLGNP